jgi:patatin-related protein
MYSNEENLSQEIRSAMDRFEENLSQEIRFAVVMYGGVSLAIYINGVTQELYRLVRSTAKGWKPPTSGTEKIYRELAEKLNARFVIDILSGTSAGGINAVFLAKALANGQDISQLQKLWLDEGNIETLLNDKRSLIEGLQTDFAKPRSLLNSQRMYKKLLEAFDVMDKTHNRSLVEELDLFVTATDLQGQKTSLRLADTVVDERRHRHVFKFKFKRKEDDDFQEENNPFLAFASRCTSSFPFAFEPMCLNDIIGSRFKEGWEKFYQSYLLDSSQIKPETIKNHPKAPRNRKGKYNTFGTRCFADGGYLDNKPFSYAIQTIGLRGSRVPVDRKLIYVEPSPEHLPDELTIAPPPNAFENALKAFSLARYETIKEDLEQVSTRNRLIGKVKSILDGTLQDIQINEEKRDPESVDNWLGTSLNRMIDKEGIAYGGYLRLRVEMLIEELAKVIASQAGFDVNSGLCHAISFIVRAWCDRRYDFYAPEEGKERIYNWCDPMYGFHGPAVWRKKSYSRFLYCFDISFFIRRLNFTITNIDRLYRMAGDSQEASKLSTEQGPELRNPYDVVRWIIEKGQTGVFRKRLSGIRDELSYRLSAIHELRIGLLRPSENSALTTMVKSLSLDSRRIASEILGSSSENTAMEKARSLIGDDTRLDDVAMVINSAVVRANLHSHLCKRLLDLGTFYRPGDRDSDDTALRIELEGFLATKNHQAEKDIRLVAKALPEVAPQDPGENATWTAAYYFRRFPHYDLVTFPILQASGVGQELDAVEIIRISPEDAKALSDAGGRKLGGTTIMHFGAFFDRTWRKNDILWGRLDGAERIISSLLTGTSFENEKEGFIKRAHKAILEETFIGDPEEREKGRSRKRGLEMLDLLTAALLGKGKPDRDAVVQQISKSQTQKEMKALIDDVLKDNLKVEGLYENFFKNYEVDRKINMESTLKVIARSAQVIGKILDSLSDNQDSGNVKKKAATWIIRIGRLLWGLVEVAMPQSLIGAFIRYWMSLLLFISFLLMVVGPKFSGGDVIQKFGLMLFFTVVVFYAAKSILRKIIFQRFRYLRVIRNVFVSILAGAILIVIGVGIFYLPEAWQSFLAATKGMP